MGNRVANLARQAGVVGAGGAGFPTHIKLDAHVDCVIVNGAECEPLITVDQVLMLNKAVQLGVMLEQVRQDLGAREAIIAIKAKHQEAVAEMKKAVASFPQITVRALKDFYPAGDEFVLVYETTGRQIPQGGIPLEVGIVVINVETLWNLAEAGEGRPLTKKWVTVSGAVAVPGTYQVPLGVSIGDMLELAGGSLISEFEVINGGPMMGKLVKNLNEPVTKTTKGLLVLPWTNPVVQLASRPLSTILRHAQSMCCQCQMCTDLCPRHLLGYDISPNKVILAASYKEQMTWATFTAAFLCSECGACDLYSCPMGLSPRRVNQAIKEEMIRQGIKNPYKGGESAVNSWRTYRRIPAKRLTSRLAVDSYKSPAILREVDFSPNRVEILLKQHIGVPSKPVVQKGDRVEIGQLIAEIPEQGNLGSNIFASISGWVLDICPEKIILGSTQE